MKKTITITTIYIAVSSSFLFAQNNLIIEGKVINNTERGTWTGVNIPRDVPVNLIYRNNSITSVNSSTYQLQAGDEDVLASNNNLKGEVISGNKLTWNGTDLTSITHGIFTGYNINATIIYNYLDKVPMAIIRKSNGMTNTAGAVAYNIIKDPIATAIAVKGMNGVNIYNNTIYSNQKMYNGSTGVWRGLIDIYANDDPVAFSSGTKIKNNIFYTVHQIYNITVLEAEDLVGFESDYNVFYCESGTPIFNYLGSKKTFAQWQSLGYDKHSVVVNPAFNNTVEFVPASRLDYGTDLGTGWQAGLSTTATWTPGASPAAANQNGKWQVGARVYNTSPVTPIIPNYVSSVVENVSPSVVEMTYSSDLANISPAASAFNVQVNAGTRGVNSVVVSGRKVRLTLAAPMAHGDIVKVSYSKPASNPLQTASGGQAASISAEPVTNNIITPNPIPAAFKMTIYPNPAHRIINIRFEYSEQETGTSNRIIKIFDISGKLVLEKSVDAAIENLQFPINLKSGIYAIVIFSDNFEITAQNLIVN